MYLGKTDDKALFNTCSQENKKLQAIKDKIPDALADRTEYEKHYPIELRTLDSIRLFIINRCCCVCCFKTSITKSARLMRLYSSGVERLD